MYQYNAKCIRVIDGDTIELQVDVGFNITYTDKFRLLGIDTPEIYRPTCDMEKLHGQEATDFVKSLILDRNVLIETEKQGKYGRYLAHVTLEDGEDLIEVLAEHGFEKKDSYC